MLTVFAFAVPLLALKLSPVGRGYELDGWPTANIVLKVHTLFFPFFFFFAYYVMLLLTVYWKADLALFRRPDLEKDQNKEQSSPENYYSPGRNTEVKQTLIYISAGKQANSEISLGFRQYKTIIMPLIPISSSSVSCCRRCLRCAKRERTRKRCSFCSAVSCWRLLFVVHAEFEVGVLAPEEFR